MKIHGFNSSQKDGLARVSATVTWEDCDRPQRDLYVETDERFANDLSCNPSTFLLAAIIPAMHHGELRVLVDEAVCPQLRDGLITAMQQLRRWYGEAHHTPVEIEATQGFKPALPLSPGRTASFMSGGVDALATLRSNRRDFPLEHPGSIRDCFLVHGIDIGGYEDMDNMKENFELAFKSLSEFAKDADVTLIPMFINLRHLDDSDSLFARESHGAVIAANAHAFSRRITRALIASSDTIPNLSPWGSHPHLDPNYSSFDVCLQHDGICLSRLEKVALIADWDAALRTLRSCNQPFRPDNAMNCGKCEKCIRTMTELLVVGKLDQCPTFPLDDISPDLLQTLEAAPSKNSTSTREGLLRSTFVGLRAPIAHYWRHLLGPLRRLGRRDLAEVIEVKLRECKKSQVWQDRKGVVRELDDKYLGGMLVKLHQRIRDRPWNSRR